MSKVELTRRIVQGLEQVANDPKMPAAKRAEAARKLAEWKAAAS